MSDHIQERHQLCRLESTQRLEPARTLIISLGANDYRGIDTLRNIRRLRSQAQARKVYWILPSERLKPAQVKAVQQIAVEYGDTVIARPESNISADGVHPTYRGYQVLGNLTK
jgi:lysophospholipase L1-like esterase